MGSSNEIDHKDWSWGVNIHQIGGTRPQLTSVAEAALSQSDHFG